jgi:drug/metabolite transporter (DMT)-like permease
MIGPVVLGLVLSLGAALLFGLATIWQAIGVRRRAAAAAASGGRSAAESTSALLRLLADRWYVAGSALDLIGAVAAAVALQHLPLFIVESCIAASIAVTAVIAVPVLGIRLHPREIGALLVVGLGLVLLAVSSSPAPAEALPTAAAVALLAGVGVVAAVAWRALRTTSSIAMAVTCGIAFSFMGLAERTLALPNPWWHVASDPNLYSVLGYGAVGVTAYASAIARGKVTTVTGVTFAVETACPSLIGVLALNDAPRSGFALVAVAGFLATVGGAIGLTRVAEMTEGTPTTARTAVEPAG